MSLHRVCCCARGTAEPLTACPGVFDLLTACSPADEVTVVAEDIQVRACLEVASSCDELVEVSSTQSMSSLSPPSGSFESATSDGTRWATAEVGFACLPTGWSSHPDGASNYWLVAITMSYDTSANDCGLSSPSVDPITLFAVSTEPRTTTDRCIPTGEYVAIGYTTNAPSTVVFVEPTLAVGACDDYDDCVADLIGPSRCIESVGTITVSVA